MSKHSTAPTSLDGEEICCICHTPLGYPKNLHVDDPRRLGNYTEGVGQSCSHCAAKDKPASAVPIPPFE